MKRKLILFIIVLSSLCMLFAQETPEYGKVIDITTTDLSGIKVELPLSFSLSDSERYEFGFTQDNNISMSTNTNPCSEIVLSQNKSITDLTGEKPYIAASATFKVYWKIVSGKTLDFSIRASGPFKSTDSASTEVIHYSIMRQDAGSNWLAILGARKGEIISSSGGIQKPIESVDYNNYTTSVTLDSYEPDWGTEPDYANQKLWDSGYIGLSIVSNENILDNPFFDKLGNPISYVTTLTLGVTVK